MENKIISDINDIRLDIFICEKDSVFNRSAASKHIKDKKVLVNGKEKSKSYKVKIGDVIEYENLDVQSMDAKPQDIPLNIVYEDDDIIIVNKEKSMIVHPAPGNYDNTMVNGLLYHFNGNLSSINGEIRPGIIHRIDKNTSGLLVVAKNNKAHEFIANQIKDHSFTREYRAIIVGSFKEDGKIETNINRSIKDRKKMAVCIDGGRKAITHFKTLESVQGFSYIKVNLETGRTHQIRVHMAYKGHPVVNDDIYNPNKYNFGYAGQCLHAKKLGFIHPGTKEYIEFDSDLPDYFKMTLRILKFSENIDG